MKLKNIYTMCMGLSIFFGVFPLLALVIANIFGYINNCWWITGVDIAPCYDAGLIATLFTLSVYWVITLPVWIIFLWIFYFMYLTVRHK